jgi:hypothetical protein
MFTRKSLELLIDLVEIKLGHLEASDAEDRRTMVELERCRRELVALAGTRGPQSAGASALAA